MGHPLNALVGDAVLSVNEPTPGASKSERAPSELKYPRTLLGRGGGGRARALGVVGGVGDVASEGAACWDSIEAWLF